MPSRISQEEAEALFLPNGRSVAEEVAGFDRFSDLMDTRFRIAGVPFGLDSLLGLLPVAGDAVTGAAGLYALGTALRLKLPVTAHIQIIWNLVVDMVIGSVPLAGDVFDFFFRSHRRNFRVVEKHLIRRAKRHHKAMAKA